MCFSKDFSFLCRNASYIKILKKNLFLYAGIIRDRAKLLQESILKLDKYRNIVMKRRLRNEAQTVEKANSSNLLKMGSQVHQSNSDMGNARPEERTKLAIPNRRVRSSMAEVRVCIFLFFLF